MGWLQGDVVLVTGGGSGLGRALVERFLDEGAVVGILERDEAKVAQLKKDFGDKVCAVAGDVTSYRDNEMAVRATVECFGKLDTFVANAGIFDFFAGLAQLDAEQLGPAFDELFAVNVKAGLLGAKAALPELLKSRGSMIFTVSNSGFYPGGGGPIYTASKHALVGVIRQLAHELAPNVRVNGVAPGGMVTQLSGLAATGTAHQQLDQIDHLDAILRDITPLRVSPEARDYCGPFVLLASRENAATITGVVINTDGGLGVRGIMKVNGGDELQPA